MFLLFGEHQYGFWKNYIQVIQPLVRPRMSVLAGSTKPWNMFHAGFFLTLSLDVCQIFAFDDILTLLTWYGQHDREIGIWANNV